MDLTRLELLEIINALDESSDLRKKVQAEFDEQLEEGIRERKRVREQERLDREGICVFEMSWAGRCRRHSWKGANVQMCKEHFETKCSVCDEQAYLSCSDFSGSFVCGMDVCKRHQRHQSDHSHRTATERMSWLGNDNSDED